MNLNFLSISRGKKIPIQRLKKVNTVVFASGKWVLVVKQGKEAQRGTFTLYALLYMRCYKNRVLLQFSEDQ